MVKLAMNRISGKHWSSIFLFFSIAFLAAASIVHFSSPAEATTGYWNGNSPRNYYRVYLSPAWHSSTAGARGECLNKSERSMARVTAYHASVYDWVSGMFTLRERGYDVAVGIGSPVPIKMIRIVGVRITISRSTQMPPGVVLHQFLRQMRARE